MRPPCATRAEREHLQCTIQVYRMLPTSPPLRRAFQLAFRLLAWQLQQMSHRVTPSFDVIAAGVPEL